MRKPRSIRQTARAPRGSRRSGLPRWLLLLGRVVVILCALQLSGAPHVVVAAIATSGGCIDASSGSCDDDDDCPPGCPDCVCAHGRLPSLPPALVVTLPEQLAWDVLEVSTPYRRGAPPSPPLPPLYRPPRA